MVGNDLRRVAQAPAPVCRHCTAQRQFQTARLRSADIDRGGHEAQREHRAADIRHDIPRRLVEYANTKLRIPAGKFAVPADFVVRDNCRLERRNAGGVTERRCRNEQSAQIQQVWQLDAARKRDTNGVIRIGLPDHAAVEAGFGQRAPVPIGVRETNPGRERAAATERKMVNPHGVGQRQVGLDAQLHIAAAETTS